MFCDSTPLMSAAARLAVPIQAIFSLSSTEVLERLKAVDVYKPEAIAAEV